MQLNFLLYMWYVASNKTYKRMCTYTLTVLKEPFDKVESLDF